MSTPTSMAFAPDGRLFVLEQGGSVRVIENGSLLSTPFLSLTVDSTEERGLLGIAFDPNFASNGYVYLYETVPASLSSDGSPYNQVIRVTASGDTAVPGSITPIFQFPDLTNTNHNGGGMNFLPDGTLLIGVGENGHDPLSQSLNTLLGKMVRINSDGTIPTDNPFYNTLTGDNRAIWAYGLRNPFTSAVQPGTGLIYINDVGKDTAEEIDQGVAGANYGWPNEEGYSSGGGYTSPLYAYSHGNPSQYPYSGTAITGGTFYDPVGAASLSSAYEGEYFFSDFIADWIHIYDPATQQVSILGTGLDSPVDLDVSPTDGSLYYLANGSGSVYRISGTGATAAPEPATDGLLLAGFVGASAFARLRRRQRGG